MPLLSAIEMGLESETEQADRWQCYVDYEKIASGGLFV
jgi:hypothetical protein